MILTLDAKRRLTIPAALVRAAAGDAFDAVYDEQEDEIVLRRVKHKRESWLKVLKECPVPMGDMPPRSREHPKKLNL